MKKSALCLFVAVLTAAVAHAVDQVPLFNAVITTGKESRFILISPTGQTSEWIRVGDAFDGYTVKAFDPATAELTIEQNNVATKLSLVEDAAVKAGAPGTTGTMATLADAEQVLEAMRFEELLEKTLAQQKQQSLAMVRQMTGQMKVPGVKSEDVSAFQEKVMDQVMSVMDATQMKKDVAQIYTEVFTKEQMAAQTAFYTTPAGRAIVDKTPEVQARLQALMMPRMQAIMPKIIQMGQQFQAEQQAKAAAAAAAAPAPATPTKS